MNIKEELDKFKEVNISPDLSGLSSQDKKFLGKLVSAAKIVHEIFLDQVHPKNLELKKELEKYKGTDKEDLLRMFEIHCAPFDSIKHVSFVEGYSYLQGANFYPEDLTVEEFDEFLENNPDKENSFKSNFTVIRRKDDSLVSIPYSVVYKKELEKIVSLLKEASAFTSNESMKTYLLKVCESFFKDDYFDSDVAWIDLDGDFEVLFGPYEVYMDGLLGLKATFEAVIGVVDKKSSSDLKFLEEVVNELEDNLPLPSKHKRSKKGGSTPIVVIDEVFSAGDNRAGIHFTAFNLPNDERVKEQKGSKKVMLRNIAKAKYENCMLPIIREVFDENTLEFTDFDSYFTHILLHEVSHGIGPGMIKVDGEEVSVNSALKDLYPTIEEAKADILGVFNSFYLRDKKIYTEDFAKRILTSYVGGIFRSIRFGVHEAHAGANLIVLNYLMEKSCLLYDHKSGKFRIRYDFAEQVFKNLAEKILLLEAEGDYDSAKNFIIKYKDLTPGIMDILKRLEHAPTDILPNYDSLGL